MLVDEFKEILLDYIQRRYGEEEPAEAGTRAST
jgi:hypothetical protein